VLYNSWEGCVFNFNHHRLVDLADRAKDLGCELFVLDDGWFGQRNDDKAGLGDYNVNKKKLPKGLEGLSKAIRDRGMQFGLWFEPESVNPDSDLYRAHPDWAIQVPGRVAGLARNQYVLDMSRKEIQDYIFDLIAGVLRSANIEYVKWDMNRPLADIGSHALSAECQGELYHRYVLGMYRLQERLVTEFPHILLENCSGGGARFDAGMLYYSPQIWCSDDTDAIERLSIQEGTALIYPLSAMGAHVSDCPNHTVGRVTPFETRGYVALAGTFGYELDVTKIPEEDRNMIPQQVAMYHKYNDLVRTGDYWRIASYQQNHMYDCWMVVSKDKREALVTFIQVMGRANAHSRRILLKGLDAEKTYRIEGEERTYLGSTLMQAGILVGGLWGDYKGKLIHIVEV
jgi:alpha-galactosidase